VVSIQDKPGSSAALPGCAPWLLVLALFAMSAPGIAMAQERASEPAKRIFVATFDGKFGAEQLHDKVVSRLHANHEIRLVDSAAEADLVVHGNGEIWLKGKLAVNAHPTTSVREPVYGGYLSVEVQRRSGEMVWSYLVTPSRMHWGDVDADMADHMVRLMLPQLQHAGASPTPQAAPAQRQLTLSGAGSTFSAPLYQSWIESYEEIHPGIHATYQAVGSEDGIRLLEDGKVDFAASDVPVTDEQMATMPVKVDQYATVLGGVVPVYNLNGVGQDLKFTPEILAGIYLGKITKWNDPKLRAINHGVSLPDAPIVVLHRSDGSGTSYAWTECLSGSSPEWNATAGSGMKVQWPVGEGVAGNEALAAGVAKTPNAIGYVELTFAIHHELSYGQVKNAAGRFVQANLDSLSDAASTAATNRDLRTTLMESADKNAYPITTFTWILVPRAAGDAAKQSALREILHWMLTSGQKECSGLGYVPLPKNVAERELTEAHPVSAGGSGAM
jgi:phosphate transport system substrate-binding protein